MTDIQIKKQIEVIKKATEEASKTPESAKKFLQDAGIINETKKGICLECGKPLLIPTSYGYHPACVNAVWEEANDIVEDMLSAAEHFQTECQVLTKEIIEQNPKCSVQDATNVWMFNKLAEFEIRLRQLEFVVE